ncbi:TetR/AcrR family transcriptional regulator [Nocardia gipuzkoensis]
MTRSTSAARPAASPARRRIRGLDAEQRSAQRRSQLLDAATELFAEQGFAGTSIEQICQRAYVGTKGFYDHFESKEACYLALLEQVTAQIQQRVADIAATTADAAWPQRVAAIVGAFVHAITDDPRLGRVTFGAAGGILTRGRTATPRQPPLGGGVSRSTVVPRRSPAAGLGHNRRHLRTRRGLAAHGPGPISRSPDR